MATVRQEAAALFFAGDGGLTHCNIAGPSLSEAPHAKDGAVAQLGERCNRTAEVRGSIPLGSTMIAEAPKGSEVGFPLKMTPPFGRPDAFNRYRKSSCVSAAPAVSVASWAIAPVPSTS